MMSSFGNFPMTSCGGFGDYGYPSWCNYGFPGSFGPHSTYYGGVSCVGPHQHYGTYPGFGNQLTYGNYPTVGLQSSTCPTWCQDCCTYYPSYNSWSQHNNLCHPQRVFSSELNLQPSRPANLMEHCTLLQPIRVDHEGNRCLNCCFDLRGYKPEEINVTLNSKERCLNIEANHEIKHQQHYIKRHYSRKVRFPEDLKVDLSKLELKTCLNNEGLLCIEAALPRLSLEEARTMWTTGKVMSTIHPNTLSNVYNIAVKTL
jgi:HSP20 family molecular chaperone IbpA